MQTLVLKNGLKVLYKKRPGNAVVVQVMVRIGSNDETSQERGISHFLEHILFEGTTKRPTNQEISNQIEQIGGDFNAYTTNERTCFYVKVLKKHFARAVDILSDILQHSLFLEEHIKKEKNIVLKEIDMLFDEPGYFQWIVLQENIFRKHPARYPTYGDPKVIKLLNREKILDYFQRYYVPSNMVVAIVGDVPGWKESVKRHFSVMKHGKKHRKRMVKEPLQSTNRVITKRKDIVNSYTVLGFKTAPRIHKDVAVLEIINAILGRGQSGKMFTEIRSKRGLAYDVGTQNFADLSFGFFAVYATIDKKNIALVRRLILREIEKLADITEQEVEEAKECVEGNYLLDIEEPQKLADQLLFWEQIGSPELMDRFMKNIREVTVNDVTWVIKKYFRKYTQVILQGK